MIQLMLLVDAIVEAMDGDLKDMANDGEICANAIQVQIIALELMIKVQALVGEAATEHQAILSENITLMHAIKLNTGSQWN